MFFQKALSRAGRRGNMEREEFKKKIPQLERLYIIYSRLTHLPYVECNRDTFDDECFLYTEEEKAVEKAKALTEDKRTAVAVKVDKKDVLKTLSGFFTYGINMLVFRAEGEEYRFELTELIKRPDLSRLPKGARTAEAVPENPSLQLSMMYFLQEVRREGEKPDSEACRKMEEEMAANLQRARYFLPVQETEKDGKKAVQIMMIKLKNGTVMLPVFSDGLEFLHFNGEKKAKLILTDIEKMDKMALPDEAAGFMLNPAGVGLPLTRSYVAALAGSTGE